MMPLVDELDGADIDAARRLADDQHVRVPLHLAGQHDLLLVAAGEIGGLQPGVRPGGCRISAIFSSASGADRLDVEERRRSGTAGSS